MRIQSLFPLLGMVAVVTLTACDSDDPVAPESPTTFTATMTGAKEKPNPVSPSGNGTATFTLDTQETALTYSITVQNMTSTITAAHIHLGNANVAGGVIVGLVTPVNGSTVTGTIISSTALGLGVSWSSLINLMRNGDAYVNVHTANNPGGEIRGQLEVTP
jgi:hypothetical protein